VSGFNQELGARGEEIAAGYYKEQGYAIIARNYRAASDEIDIIAENDRSVVFVEVKTRSAGNEGFGRPSLAVNSRKRMCLVRCAQAYIRKNRTSKFHRFDVVEVVVNGDTHKLTCIKNAFGSDGKVI
jgi:putative endonuclease